MMRIIKVALVTLWLLGLVGFGGAIVYTIATKGWDGFMRPAMEAMGEEMKPSLPTPHE